jgi:hypothetical protein
VIKAIIKLKQAIICKPVFSPITGTGSASSPDHLVRQGGDAKIFLDKRATWGMFDSARERVMNLRAITHRFYWNKKLKIALLTLATFIALC